MPPKTSYMLKASNFMSGRILRAYSEHLTLFSDLETKRGYIGCLSLQRKVVIFGITTKTTRVGGSL